MAITGRQGARYQFRMRCRGRSVFMALLSGIAMETLTGKDLDLISKTVGLLIIASANGKRVGTLSQVAQFGKTKERLRQLARLSKNVDRMEVVTALRNAAELLSR